MNPAVQSYLDDVPPDRRTRLLALHDLITAAFPQAVSSMRYKMPTYELGSNWVAMANQKRYVSLYTCCYDHIAAFRKKHRTIKGGKGCLNFRDGDELPLEDLTEVVRSALTMEKSGRAG